MDALLNQLDDNLKELYRKALDADALLDNLQQQGHGKHQRIFADNTLFQASSNRFMPYLAETAEQVTYEQWVEEGGNDALTRASKLASEKLRAYEPPPLEPDKDEELRTFIAKRKEKLPCVIE